MINIIKQLKAKGYFTQCKVDDKGHGTFISRVHNKHIAKARMYKKQADNIKRENTDKQEHLLSSQKQSTNLQETKVEVNESDKDDCIVLYINAMICYIDGYKEEEDKKISKDILLGYYKGLYTYVCGIYNMPCEPYKQYLRTALIAIKFYCIKIQAEIQDNALSRDIRDLYSMYKSDTTFYSLQSIVEEWRQTHNK